MGNIAAVEKKELYLIEGRNQLSQWTGFPLGGTTNHSTSSTGTFQHIFLYINVCWSSELYLVDR